MDDPVGGAKWREAREQGCEPHWARVAGSPGPGDTAVLLDGPGFDFSGLIAVEGNCVVIRRRDDTDADVQIVPIEDLAWLLKEHAK